MAMTPKAEIVKDLKRANRTLKQIEAMLAQIGFDLYPVLADWKANYKPAPKKTRSVVAREFKAEWARKSDKACGNF